MTWFRRWCSIQPWSAPRSHSQTLPTRDRCPIATSTVTAHIVTPVEAQRAVTVTRALAARESPLLLLVELTGPPYRGRSCASLSRSSATTASPTTRCWTNGGSRSTLSPRASRPLPCLGVTGARGLWLTRCVRVRRQISGLIVTCYSEDHSHWACVPLPPFFSILPSRSL